MECVVEILNFRHFADHKVFEQSGEKEKTKSIRSRVTVYVVVELESGDM